MASDMDAGAGRRIRPIRSADGERRSRARDVATYHLDCLPILMTLSRFDVSHEISRHAGRLDISPVWWITKVPTFDPFDISGALLVCVLFLSVFGCILGLSVATTCLEKRRAKDPLRI